MSDHYSAAGNYRDTATSTDPDRPPATSVPSPPTVTSKHSRGHASTSSLPPLDMGFTSPPLPQLPQEKPLPSTPPSSSQSYVPFSAPMFAPSPTTANTTPFSPMTPTDFPVLGSSSGITLSNAASLSLARQALSAQVEGAAQQRAPEDTQGHSPARASAGGPRMAPIVKNVAAAVRPRIQGSSRTKSQRATLVMVAPGGSDRVDLDGEEGVVSSMEGSVSGKSSRRSSFGEDSAAADGRETVGGGGAQPHSAGVAEVDVADPAHTAGQASTAATSPPNSPPQVTLQPALELTAPSPPKTPPGDITPLVAGCRTSSDSAGSNPGSGGRPSLSVAPVTLVAPPTITVQQATPITSKPLVSMPTPTPRAVSATESAAQGSKPSVSADPVWDSWPAATSEHAPADASAPVTQDSVWDSWPAANPAVASETPKPNTSIWDTSAMPAPPSTQQQNSFWDTAATACPAPPPRLAASDGQKPVQHFVPKGAAPPPTAPLPARNAVPVPPVKEARIPVVSVGKTNASLFDWHSQAPSQPPLQTVERSTRRLSDASSTGSVSAHVGVIGDMSGSAVDDENGPAEHLATAAQEPFYSPDSYGSHDVFTRPRAPSYPTQPDPLMIRDTSPPLRDDIPPPAEGEDPWAGDFANDLFAHLTGGMPATKPQSYPRRMSGSRLAPSETHSYDSTTSALSTGSALSGMTALSGSTAATSVGGGEWEDKGESLSPTSSALGLARKSATRRKRISAPADFSRNLPVGFAASLGYDRRASALPQFTWEGEQQQSVEELYEQDTPSSITSDASKKKANRMSMFATPNPTSEMRYDHSAPVPTDDQARSLAPQQERDLAPSRSMAALKAGAEQQARKLANRRSMFDMSSKGYDALRHPIPKRQASVHESTPIYASRAMSDPPSAFPPIPIRSASGGMERSRAAHMGRSASAGVEVQESASGGSDRPRGVFRAFGGGGGAEKKQHAKSGSLPGGTGAGVGQGALPALLTAMAPGAPGIAGVVAARARAATIAGRI